MGTKWIATVASIWIQCTCGASYTFGIYSSILKSSQSYDQSTLDTVSVFKDIGSNFGILSGLLYSALDLRRRHRQFAGPWVVHAVGAVQCFLGYFLLWATVVGFINKPPLPFVCLFMFLAAHAQTFFNTANVVTGVQNFPDFSGTIVGILKGFLGLSGAILIQLYDTLFKGKPSTFILMLAVTPTLVSLVLMTLVRIYEQNNLASYDKLHLNAFSVIALSTAAYLMIVILLENIFGLPLSARIVGFILLLLLLSSPLEVAIRAGREQSSERLLLLPSSEESPPTGTSSLTVSSKLDDPSEYHEILGDNSDKDHNLDLSLIQAMRTLNFWLLFVATVCGMGSGLATINNISQIGESLGYTMIEINSLVSLWSIWNFLGRFGAGYVSDVFLHQRGWARPIFMAMTLATMSIGHLIVAFGFPGNLYIGSVVVGICYGSQWSLMPTISSEIFGVRHFGTIFNTIAVASPLGSYIFSVKVIGYFYDKETAGDDNSCSGTECFMVSFLIMASVAFFGFLVAGALFFRTRRFYSQDLLRRLQHSSQT